MDPRSLPRILERLTTFQLTGHQRIGGVRLTVLGATDPGRLTRRALLPAVSTPGQPVEPLELRADQDGSCTPWP